MPRKSSKPKRNPFTDPLYGTYEGPRGSTEQWRSAFKEAINPEEAEKIVGDNSPWAILGISPGASLSEIKRAWRKKALELHPDRHATEKDYWTQNFIKAKAAYVTLTLRI